MGNTNATAKGWRTYEEKRNAGQRERERGRDIENDNQTAEIIQNHWRIVSQAQNDENWQITSRKVVLFVALQS